MEPRDRKRKWLYWLIILIIRILSLPIHPIPREPTQRFQSSLSHPLRTRCPPKGGRVNQTELFNALERQHCRATRIIFGFSTDMPTVDVLATVKWNTLTHLYQCFLIKLCYKGYHGMLPRILAEQIFFNRSSSRLKHGLIAPSFAFKYVQNSMGLSRL